MVFFVGLMAAAFVVEAFESVLKNHVELSYFVPLLIGHGGNTGSQSNATVIRALALGHLRPADYLIVLRKEAIAGGLMGALLGSFILALSFLWCVGGRRQHQPRHRGTADALTASSLGFSARHLSQLRISLPSSFCWPSPGAG